MSIPSASKMAITSSAIEAIVRASGSPRGELVPMPLLSKTVTRRPASASRSTSAGSQVAITPPAPMIMRSGWP